MQAPIDAATVQVKPPISIPKPLHVLPFNVEGIEGTLKELSDLFAEIYDIEEKESENIDEFASAYVNLNDLEKKGDSSGDEGDQRGRPQAISPQEKMVIERRNSRILQTQCFHTILLNVIHSRVRTLNHIMAIYAREKDDDGYVTAERIPSREKQMAYIEREIGKQAVGKDKSEIPEALKLVKRQLQVYRDILQILKSSGPKDFRSFETLLDFRQPLNKRIDQLNTPKDRRLGEAMKALLNVQVFQAYRKELISELQDSYDTYKKGGYKKEKGAKISIIFGNILAKIGITFHGAKKISGSDSMKIKISHKAGIDAKARMGADTAAVEVGAGATGEITVELSSIEELVDYIIDKGKDRELLKFLHRNDKDIKDILKAIESEGVRESEDDLTMYLPVLDKALEDDDNDAYLDEIRDKKRAWSIPKTVLNGDISLRAKAEVGNKFVGKVSLGLEGVVSNILYSVWINPSDIAKTLKNPDDYAAYMTDRTYGVHLKDFEIWTGAEDEDGDVEEYEEDSFVPLSESDSLSDEQLQVAFGMLVHNLEELQSHIDLTYRLNRDEEERRRLNKKFFNSYKVMNKNSRYHINRLEIKKIEKRLEVLNRDGDIDYPDRQLTAILLRNLTLAAGYLLSQIQHRQVPNSGQESAKFKADLEAFSRLPNLVRSDMKYYMCKNSQKGRELRVEGQLKLKGPRKQNVEGSVALSHLSDSPNHIANGSTITIKVPAALVTSLKWSDEDFIGELASNLGGESINIGSVSTDQELEISCKPMLEAVENALMPSIGGLSGFKMGTENSECLVINFVKDETTKRFHFQMARVISSEKRDINIPIPLSESVMIELGYTDKSEKPLRLIVNPNNLNFYQLLYKGMKKDIGAWQRWLAKPGKVKALVKNLRQPKSLAFNQLKHVAKQCKFYRTHGHLYRQLKENFAECKTETEVMAIVQEIFDADLEQHKNKQWASAKVA